MPKSRKTATAGREGRFLVTVHAWNGPGGGKTVRAFDTRADLLEHLADVVTAGKGARVGPEEVYVITILDRRQGEAGSQK